MKNEEYIFSHNTKRKLDWIISIQNKNCRVEYGTQYVLVQNIIFDLKMQY